MRMTLYEVLAHQARVRGHGVRPDSPAEDKPEEHIQDDIEAACKRRGWLVIRSRMDRPTTNQIGTPDLIVASDGGRTLWIECKRPGRKCTTEQLGVGMWLKKLCHHWVVIESLEQFECWVKSVEEL